MLTLPEGRVVMFEIPPAPRGVPVAWKNHYYGREGESLVALNLEEVERFPHLFISGNLVGVTEGPGQVYPQQSL